MKVLLTTLNAKYVHTSLALWYIYQYSRRFHPEVEFKEYNINQDLAWVCGEIYREKADVIGFSCNIWNIEQILTISRRIKQVAPDTVIILGGPEVWEDPEGILEDNPEIDYIICGEGEIAFKEWLDELKSPCPDFVKVRGLVFRDGERTVRTVARPDIEDLSVLPFPYPEDLTPFRQKLVYYETTRGCPFQCQYCLSANEKGVRYFPMERVKEELLRFIRAGIRQVKLVDRSFNCNLKWAKEIWRFLIAHPGETNFHFEVVGDLLDEEAFEILKEAPAGMFQFEIGVQSTHLETLTLIRRRMDWERLAHNVRRLVAETKVFVHLDLIAGLPAEDYLTFGGTFNQTFLLNPHRLQLGFLKLLRGSGLRARAEEYGYRFTRETPYEVLGNRWITYDELLQLKTIEELLERYHNTGRFRAALAYLISRHASPFAFFESLAQWWKRRGLDEMSHKGKDYYGFLRDYSRDHGFDTEVIRNLLKYDYLSGERSVELPEWAGPPDRELASRAYSFWKNPDNVIGRIPEYEGLSVREILRKTYMAGFDFDPRRVLECPETEPFGGPVVLLFVYGPDQVRIAEIEAEALRDE